MSIWFITPALDMLNDRAHGTLGAQLGIQFTHVGSDSLTATMPVDHRTVQPMGRLHGGASAALAETVGSMASFCVIDIRTQFCVGIELSCSHVRGATQGLVIATARPQHLGRQLHVWDIRIVDEADRLICTSRLTCAVQTHRAG